MDGIWSTCHVCGRDHEHAALCHSLYRAVHQLAGGAVGVQVHGIVRPRPLDHQHPRITLHTQEAL